MEIRNLSWGNPTENDFDLILDFYSGTKINSDRTSSVPLAQYWKNTNNAIAFIAQKIKLQSNSVSIYFEYPTKSAGKNKSSMSDVMIVSDKCKIAIEGKFTEYQKAEYESIEKWFNKSKSENRINVINHWEKIIANYSESIIDEHSQLAYQFLHRTASACFGNPDKAIVLYQLFWDVETKSMLQPFLQDFTRIKELYPINKTQ